MDPTSENVPSDMCAQRRFRSAGEFAQSDQSLHCPHDETLQPQAFKVHTLDLISANVQADLNLRWEYMSECTLSDVKANILSCGLCEKRTLTLRKHACSNIQQNLKFSDKISDIFHISAQNIDCEYSLEPPRASRRRF